MEVKELSIKGLLEIRPAIFRDDRGYFFESHNTATFKKAGLDLNFVQDNQSFSKKGTIRGLHYQSPPFAQGKLVWVALGKVLDVMVDLRKDSPDFGKYLQVELSSDDFRMLYIPPGFAHGFATLRDNTIFSYICSHTYHKESEGTVLWNDLDLNIDWQLQNPLLSEKDMNGTIFKSFQSPF